MSMATVMEEVFTPEYVTEMIEWFAAPEYDKEGVIVTYKKIVGRCDHYLNLAYEVEGISTPIFIKDGDTWMSLTPMEIQSQELPLILAGGCVGVLGLGLGYFGVRCMENDDVEAITVFEQDAKVIEYFKDSFSEREGFDKVRFIEGDARETCIGFHFDLLYNDIYLTMLPDEVISDIVHFRVNNTVEVYRFWGQERVYLDYIIEAEERLDNHPAFTMADGFLISGWAKDEDRTGLHRSACDLDFCSAVLEVLDDIDAYQEEEA